MLHNANLTISLDEAVDAVGVDGSPAASTGITLSIILAYLNLSNQSFRIGKNDFENSNPPPISRSFSPQARRR